MGLYSWGLRTTNDSLAAPVRRLEPASTGSDTAEVYGLGPLRGSRFGRAIGRPFPENRTSSTKCERTLRMPPVRSSEPQERFHQSASDESEPESDLNQTPVDPLSNPLDRSRMRIGKKDGKPGASQGKRGRFRKTSAFRIAAFALRGSRKISRARVATHCKPPIRWSAGVKSRFCLIAASTHRVIVYFAHAQRTLLSGTMTRERSRHAAKRRAPACLVSGTELSRRWRCVEKRGSANDTAHARRSSRLPDLRIHGTPLMTLVPTNP